MGWSVKVPTLNKINEKKSYFYYSNTIIHDQPAIKITEKNRFFVKSVINNLPPGIVIGVFQERNLN